MFLRVSTGQDIVQGGGQAINIGPFIDLSRVLLGRGKSGRANQGGLALGRENSGDTKVNQRDAPVRSQDHIAGFHIPIDDGRRKAMQIGQHVAQFPANLDDPALGELTAQSGDFLLQIDPFDKVHHQIMTIALPKAIKNGGNGRMGELGQGIGLAMKILNGLSALFGIRKPIKNFLNGDLSLGQPLVLGNIDDTHPAAGQKTLNLIAAGQDRSRFELTAFISRHR